jgi:hypothetical protein
MSRVPPLLLVALVLALAACHHHGRSEYGFVTVSADHHVGPSAYPVAVDPARVGDYPTDTKAGAGYFYDDVLEYRVWMHPENGSPALNGTKDYVAAFAQYEAADAFSKKTKGAEPAIVLVLQREWIDEPEPGKYIPRKGERITEWQVQWLKEDKRGPTSISDFMKNPRPLKGSNDEERKEE